MVVVPEQRLPWIFWGDGSQGQLISKKQIGDDDDGVKMTEIRFRPTEELLSLHGIPRSDLDQEYSLAFRFPSAYVITLSEDPVNSTVLIMCDIRGRDTKLTNMNAASLDTIMGYEKRIKSLQAQNAWLHAELKKMTSHVNEYIKGNAEMFLEAIKVRGEIDNPMNQNGQDDQ
jgi:hypothetical protein